MKFVQASLVVKPDGTVTVSVPLPEGEHQAHIQVFETGPYVPFDVNELPVRDTGPWPEGMNMMARREDIYGDDGR